MSIFEPRIELPDSIVDVVYADIPLTNDIPGPKWIEHLMEHGVVFNDPAREILIRMKSSKDAKRRIAVLVLKDAHKNNNNSYLHISTEAERLKLIAPKLETMCQLRDLCTTVDFAEAGFANGLMALYPDLKSVKSNAVEKDGSPQCLGMWSQFEVKCMSVHSYGFKDIVDSAKGYVFGVAPFA